MGDAAVVVGLVADFGRLGHLAWQNAMGQMDLHHSPPQHLGRKRFWTSRGFALDARRPQRRMGARTYDPKGSDVRNRMACGRSGAARGRAVDAIHANWTSKYNARFGGGVDSGPSHLRGVPGTKPCCGRGEVSKKCGRLARPRRLDVERGPKVGRFRGPGGRASPHSRGCGHGHVRPNCVGSRFCAEGLGRHVVAPSHRPGALVVVGPSRAPPYDDVEHDLPSQEWRHALSGEVCLGRPTKHLGDEASPQAKMATGLRRV